MPAPTFNPTTYNGTVAENVAAGAALGTVVATDTDGPAITYAITDGNQNNFYAIDPSTGALTTAQPLDYETTAGSTLTITATDAANETATAVFEVSVTDVDEAPVAGAPAPLSVAENLPAGAAAGTVSATDPEGSPLTYALTTAGTPFRVNSVTGVVTTAAALDREVTPSYTLDFTARDATGNATAFSATVAVTNVDEPPTPGADVTATLAEDAVVGTPVGTVTATDPENASLTYALTTDDVPFEVDTISGEITTTAALDVETRASYTLALTASDGTSTVPLSATVSVTNVDERPVAGARASLSVAENLPAGAPVGSVSATDPEGAALTYALTTAGAPFAVSDAGVVTTTAPLDREQLASYLLDVTASDGTTTPTAFSASVAVTNVNEAPVAGGATSFSVAENLPAGTPVGAVSASDPEAGQWATRWPARASPSG